jgi:beta-glucosidase
MASGATLTFPERFLWGVATSSHQYEGECLNNQWHAWELGGHIKTGDTCGLACDWWRNAERDFDLARELGLNALRLSLEWSRIEPRPGEWDAAAFARYREMLGGLRQRGIEPMVTLHHFTHPLWLEERGGFLAPDAVERFARYSERVVQQLSDLCDFWCTINEPNIYAIVGYLIGDFPPGRKGDFRAAIRVQASMARAHAAAYHAIHRIQPSARVGWAQQHNFFDPANPRSPLDRFAAHQINENFNGFFPRAVRIGRASFPGSLFAGDLKAARDTCDYYGVNLYYRDLVSFDLKKPGEAFSKRSVAPGAPRSDQPYQFSWGEVYPDGIARIAQQLAPLGKPIYITEHGVADAADRLRPWLLVRAARALHDAVSAGADVRGYFHWSLVDNFEWAEGWRTRFGLTALDVATQVRTLRPSAHLYSAFAHANALTPEIVAEYAPDALETTPSRPTA